MRLLTFLLAAHCFAAELPPAVKSYLDSRHRGWKLAKVAPQIESWFREYRFAYDPNLLIADFDGDGRRDYAVRIESGSKALTIAFMDRAGKFEAYPLTTDDPDPFTFLLLYAKGDKDFDFTTLKPFRHRTDAIGVMYFQKTPFTFIYRKGGFRRMLSLSDEDLE